MNIEMGKSQSTKDFLSVFKQYEKSLRKFISGFLVNTQDIEDISQETFLRTYKSSESTDISKPKSFMFRVAKNLIISEYRRSSFKLTDYIEDFEQEPLSSVTDSLEEQIESEEKLRIFCDALSTLPAQCRKVVIMRKVFGLSIKDISEKTGMPVSTVNWNIAKGLVHCDDAADQSRHSQHKMSVCNQQEKVDKDELNSILEDVNE